MEMSRTQFPRPRSAPARANEGSAEMACNTKREAEDHLAEKLPESRHGKRPATDPKITIEDYSKRWKRLIAESIRPSTLQRYNLDLRSFIVPAFGAVKV